MKIEVFETQIRDVKIIIPEKFEDGRGFFMEVFREDIFKKHGLPNNFVQLNHSGSVKNVLRGIHFQWEPPMGKLMRVTKGEAFLVAVDIRVGSPTIGKYVGEVVSVDNRKQIWAPAGFARGFCVMSDYSEIQYLVTGTYNQKAESGIAWNDPDLNIKWPVEDPITSEKDDNAQSFKMWLSNDLSNFFIY